MHIRKFIAVSCIIFFGFIIFCLNMPALSQYLPWSWPPASTFPNTGQIPLYNYPPLGYFPSAGPYLSSGWPSYFPPTFYRPAPTQAPTSGNCPIGLVTGLTLEEEFGPGASQITRCIIFTYGIKVLFRLNHLEYTPGTPITRPLTTLIDDYAITHGTTDFKIAAIIHSAGLPLALNRNAPVPHPEAIFNDQQPIIEDLISKGVKFYL